MKRFAPIFLLILLALACNKPATETSSSDEWPALDAFHMLMAEAYHPMKDSANLAPAKLIAEEMAVNAAAWAGETLPAKVDNDEVKQQLQDLKARTRAFADMVKAQAPDSVLSKELESMHGSFHGIMGKWGNAGEHKHSKEEKH